MSSAEAELEKRTSRRRVLRSAILFSAVGAGIILGADRVVGEASSPSGEGSNSNGTSLTSPSDASGISGDSLTVKVVYFGMPQTVTSSKEEYFTLQSPAYFRDILSKVVEKHPLISTMIPTMIISVDGVPGQPSKALKDGDEIELVPAIAGG